MTRLSSARRRDRGAALISALILLTALGALAGAYAMNVRSTLTQSGIAGARRSAFYAAEAGLNVGIARFANIFHNSGVPRGLDFTHTMAIGDKSVSVALTEVDGCTPCPSTTIPEGEVFAGLNTLPYRYTAQSVSAVPPGGTAHVGGEFEINTIPIFQFLAFIDSHLFIMPLPDMTLHGRLHTNSDLYIQPDATLVVGDDPPAMPHVQITATGQIHRGGRKYDSSWRCWGTAIIDKLEDSVPPLGDLDPKPMPCPGDGAPLSEAFLSGWSGAIKGGVRNIVAPPVDIIERGSGEYWKRADLRIVLNLSVAPVAENFRAADLCPGGLSIPLLVAAQPALAPIEVHDAAGAVDVAKTRQLLRFMCERRGALFYTDVPTAAGADPSPGVAANPASYSPGFASADVVYRRAGEDTTGNGALSTWDRNDDICPAGGLLAPSPWWRPPSCPWPKIAAGASSWWADMDYRRGGFYNHRERQWMNLLNLNLRALIEWNQMNGDPLFAHDDRSDGGLVLFLTVVGPGSAAANNNYGVRIFDSADLDMRNVTFPPGDPDPTGVTVVSDQAAIVQGNFNNTDKYPAAIMADAIWILSQGWEVPVANRRNDLKSMFPLASGIRAVPAADWPAGAGGTGSFTASNGLSINAAFLFGLGPNTRDPDWYNGGLENFPRFLEDWRNRTLNYRGSFVSLGAPRHKRNDWACGSGTGCEGGGIYEPPTRAYDYDTDFNLVENLPPMTPKVVYVQQRIYTRLYD
jgi:Tfp pilus assembly protein PilX